MIHDRPYSTALAHEEALRELRENAGTQFDPAVVEVFCSIYGEAVPPDGLEEVYRLHERMVDGLTHVDTNGNGHGHVHRPTVELAPKPARRTRTPRAKAARRREAAAQ
jgi:hypothetical protein